MRRKGVGKIAGISTSLELIDKMSGPMMNIMSSVNLVISAFEGVQGASDGNIDTASLNGAKECADKATAAMIQLQESFQNLVPPTPVSIPVEWQTPNNVDVFSGSGMERYQQEIASTNQLLNQVTQNQQRIAAMSNKTDVFPDNAIADLQAMNTEINGLQSEIQKIRNNPINDIGADTVNNKVETLRGKLNRTVQAQNDLTAAMERMDISAMNVAYNRLNGAVDSTKVYIRDNINAQDQFNSSIRNGTTEAGGLFDKIKSFVGVYALIRGAGAALDLSDGMTQTTARLNLMNDGLQSTDQLFDKIFLSAQRSRTDLMATADVVAKLGQRAGDAFSSNDETIQFAENLNKMFVIAGTGQQEITSASLQLTQALGSGVLRGEELNAVFEAAPSIIQTVADYLDVPIGKIREMASDGEITSDIVKNAMLGATDKINQQFDSMPMTFGQAMTLIKNNAIVAFQPVFVRLNELANSHGFQNLADGITGALVVVSGMVIDIFDLVARAADFISDNWSLLSPIIYGVAAALGVYYGAQLLANGVGIISKGIHFAMAAAQMIHLAATGALNKATAGATAAQYGLNSALLACPLVWIVIAIIAVISAIYLAVAAYNKFTNSTVSGTGVIVGVIFAAGAAIGNIFIALINFVIDIFVVLWNFIAAFANLFANVFVDPVGAIARLFFDLVDTVLNLLQSLASAIDTIFGLSLAGGVQSWRNKLGGWVDNTFGKGVEVMETVNAEDWKLDRFVYKDAYNAGYKKGEEIDAAIKNFDWLGKQKKKEDDDKNKSLPGEYLQSTDVPKNVSDIAGNTGDIKDAVDISNEDLKYLRDLAERETINRYTTAKIEINQTNNNTVKSGMDLDGVTEHLNRGLHEAIDIAAEGAH